jgi:hypothetical protein
MKSLLRTGAPSVFVFICIALLSVGIHGGVPYGRGTGSVNVVGNYAGTLTPTEPDNSMGLFGVNIPKTGLGTGTVSIFVTGNAYTGTIDGTADPDRAKLTAFMNAGFNYITTVPSGTDSNGHMTFTTTTVRAVATGTINGKIKASQTNSQSTARLNGSAIVTFDGASAFAFDLPPQINYKVVGFKQD